MFEWKDVSRENVRIYYFKDGSQFQIDRPVKMAVSKSGSHRVLAENGRTYWVRGDFIAISWEGPTDY
jgi:hypothetical protein